VREPSRDVLASDLVERRAIATDLDLCDHVLDLARSDAPARRERTDVGRRDPCTLERGGPERGALGFREHRQDDGLEPDVDR
jgi:hypothetical protein